MATSSACSCFGNLRPRYKRLVDKVFPPAPQQGLVKSNMEKLTFYVLSAPEKLDRIGDYIFSKMNNHLYRKRIGYVHIAIEAMDHLLLACRSSSLNLFVESFMRMVDTLLETSEPDLQIAATESFIKFSNIEEDTPSYHRRYDFFVSKFSQMCWSNSQDPQIRRRIRASGLKGIQGVIRKTVKDDLQANIWDDSHMTKLIPSLLFNIDIDPESEERRKSSANVSCKDNLFLLSGTASEDHSDDPDYLAESCLRELVNRASFGNIGSVLRPVLEFMDSRDLWIPNDFIVHCFKIIMYSIQSQYSYKVIEGLLHHLDRHSQSEARKKANIIEVISASASATSGGSVGPSVFDVYDTLIRHLRLSVDEAWKTNGGNQNCREDPEEVVVQESIINTAGAFSSALPDYQRIEVMSFIVAKIPRLVTDPRKGLSITSSDEEFGESETKDSLLQIMLFRVLLKAAETHKSINFAATFPFALLDPLLKGLIQPNSDVRVLVLRIMQTLVDRHENLDKISTFSDCSSSSGTMDFNSERCSKQDSAFIRKNSQQIYFYLYHSVKFPTNGPQNLRAICHLICLLVLEIGEEEVLVEIVGFVLGLQNLAKADDYDVHVQQRCTIHTIVAIMLRLIAELTTIPAFRQHCDQIMENRKRHYPFLLPSAAFNEDNSSEIKPFRKISDNSIFDRHLIVSALKSSGYETSSIDREYEPNPGPVRSSSATSLPDILPIICGGALEGMSSMTPKVDCTEKITFKDLKNALCKENNKKFNTPTINFEKASFEEIVNHSNKVNQEVNTNMNRVLELACRSAGPHKPGELGNDIFSIKFPDLYVH